MPVAGAEPSSRPCSRPSPPWPRPRREGVPAPRSARPRLTARRPPDVDRRGSTDDVPAERAQPWPQRGRLHQHARRLRPGQPAGAERADPHHHGRDRHRRCRPSVSTFGRCLAHMVRDYVCRPISRLALSSCASPSRTSAWFAGSLSQRETPEGCGSGTTIVRPCDRSTFATVPTSEASDWREAPARPRRSTRRRVRP